VNGVFELRQYTLLPGRRDELIELFEREFIETQEASGIQLIGQFRDRNDPDRFVWVRAFRDMAARAAALQAFYGGPVWKAHRDAANATILDSDNVLLLRPARASSGFSQENAGHRSGASDDEVGAVIYSFKMPVDEAGVEAFERALATAHASAIAYFVTEESPNTFPALPVRENEYALVWFSRAVDAAARKAVSEVLADRLIREPETLHLSATPRSRLR
jgi:quinol monooxygenase YgiN